MPRGPRKVQRLPFAEQIHVVKDNKMASHDLPHTLLPRYHCLSVFVGSMVNVSTARPATHAIVLRNASVRAPAA